MFPAFRPRLFLFIVLFLIPRSEPAIAQWSGNGTALSTAENSQWHPTIASDGAGGAIVTWQDERVKDGVSDIYAQHVLASGAVDPAWPADGRAICTAAFNQDLPRIVADGAGGAIIVWEDNRGDLDHISDIYAQHVQASGQVDPAWPADGRALCIALHSQGGPAVATDGAGGAIVAWWDFRNGNDYDIYAQHVRAAGAVDPGWPADGLPVCNAALTQTDPAIVADGAGGAIVTWPDDRNGMNADIYAQHVRAAGTVDPAWPANGRALCSAAGDQGSPTIISDGAGGAIVSWSDLRSGNFDIYAQRVLNSGAVDPAWPANGRALCTAANAQEGPAPVADGAGGAVVTWKDNRSGISNSDIYAQHVLNSGAVDPAWPANGRALCTAANEQAGPAIATDGAGGAVVTWFDYRGGSNSDVYAQHVLNSGAVDPAWPSDGRPLSAAVGDQVNPMIVADGAGGAIVTWDDYRSGPHVDIYAQRVYADGHVAAAESGIAQAFRMHVPRPNPARGQVSIGFDLPAAQEVSVEVFDPAGRRVRTLISSREFRAGTHSVVWDGANETGAPVESGVYVVRLSAGSNLLARKLSILR